MRVLLVSAIPPTPPDFGGAQRTNLLYRALRQVAEVDLFLLFKVFDPVRRAGLVRDFNLVGDMEPPARSSLGFWRHLRPVNPGAIEKAAKLLGSRGPEFEPAADVVAAVRALHRQRRYDLGVGRYLRPTCQAGLAEVMPALVDVDDVDSQMYASRAGAPTAHPIERATYAWHAQRFRREEGARLPRFAHAFVSKAADVKALGHPHVSVLPNIPFVAPPEGTSFQRDDGTPPSILFVGASMAPANRAGLAWFLARCWPGLRARHPQLVLKVVGRGWAELVSAEARANGVECVGFVDSLAPLYREALFVVVPIHEGGGTNIKVAEAMAYERTAVVTPHAHRGYEQDFRPGEALLRGDDAEAFTNACAQLLSDPGLCRQLGENAGRVARDRYSFTAFARTVAEAVAAATSSATPAPGLLASGAPR